MVSLNLEERRWIAWLSLALICLTALPYVVAFFSTGSEWEFSGFLVGVQDGNSYLAKMLRGSQGDWLFRTPYTHLPQTGVLVFVPYLLLGKLASGQELHLQLVALFHLFRTAAIPVAVYGSYRFVAMFIQPVAGRRWGSLLALGGGGLGWLAPLLGMEAGWKSTPLAFLSPETFGFLGLLTLPHLALARGLMLLALVSYLEADSARGVRLTAGWLTLATFLVNPLSGVSLVLVMALHQLALLLKQGFRVRAQLEKELGRLSGTLLPSLPYVAYLGLMGAADPFLRAWSAQNQVLSPPAVMYVLAYALVAVPAARGILTRWRSAEDATLLPIAWIVALPLLIYAPVGIQRRLPEASWCALAVAGTWGIWELAPTLRRRLGTLILVASLIAPAILLLGVTGSAMGPSWPAFVEADYAAAYRSLGESARDGEVVLASFETSNAIPAWAPVRVAIGHGPESVRLQEIEPQVDNFFSMPSSLGAVNLLSEIGADWIIWGPQEGAFPTTPSPADIWQVVRELGSVKLLRVGDDS